MLFIRSIFLYILLYLVTAFELNVPMQNDVVDIGWKLTKHLHLFLKENPKIKDNLVLYNTFIWLLCIIYMNYLYFIYHNTYLIDKCINLYLLRAFTGFVTRLPRSEESLSSENDIPPTDHNFFYFFSAHTFILYSTTMELYTDKYIYCARFLTANLIVQSLRLLAMRGHYSIDIIIACVLSHCF